MNDEELKKQIEEALSVDPSPQFAARVRSAVVQEGRKRPGPLPWIVPILGLATAALVAGVIVVQPREAKQPKIVNTVENPPALIEPPALPVQVPQPDQPKAGKTASKPRRPSGLPEVLIDPREAAAFRNFLEDVQERKIDPAMLKGLAQAAERAEAVEEIIPMPIAAIEPIAISPMSSPVSGKEGGSL